MKPVVGQSKPTSRVIERFARKVLLPEDPYSDECWLWVGSRNRQNYGQFNYGGRVVGAHRIAYELLRGGIPEGLEIDHLCRNPQCVNPDHLEPVTDRENIMRGMLPILAKHQQVVKTHCPHGHPYSAENTYYDNKGSRVCRACKYILNKKLREQKTKGKLSAASCKK